MTPSLFTLRGLDYNQYHTFNCITVAKFSEKMGLEAMHLEPALETIKEKTCQ